MNVFWWSNVILNLKKMKYLIILILAFSVFSCSSTEQEVENITKESLENIVWEKMYDEMEKNAKIPSDTKVNESWSLQLKWNTSMEKFAYFWASWGCKTLEMQAAWNDRAISDGIQMYNDYAKEHWYTQNDLLKLTQEYAYSEAYQNQYTSYMNEICPELLDE